MSVTKETIINKLKEIEKKENVKIIFACESGSRAWGFDSPDSDFDVRFIYVRKMKDYLRLKEGRDVIEWQLDDVFDINGWDLKKFLQLAHNSNPNVLEWLHSPIVYLKTEDFDELKELVYLYYSKKKIMLHYLHMTSKDYETHIMKEQVVLKKYFYVLRSLLAAKWITQSDEYPPIEFNILKSSQLDPSMKEIVEHLLDLKKANNESFKINPILKLNEYIDQQLTMLEEKAQKYKIEYTSWEKLDEYFIYLVKKYNDFKR